MPAKEFYFIGVCCSYFDGGLVVLLLVLVGILSGSFSSCCSPSCAQDPKFII